MQPDNSTNKRIMQASLVFAAASQATVGFGMLTSSRSLGSIIRLTQYIEMLLYFNVVSPSNYMSFIKFFSRSLFELIYNPLGFLKDDGCLLPWAFDQNEVDCLPSSNLGSLLMVSFCLLLLKYVSKAFSKVFRKRFESISKFIGVLERSLSASYLAELVDGVMFDVILAVTLGVQYLASARKAAVRVRVRQQQPEAHRSVEGKDSDRKKVVLQRQTGREAVEPQDRILHRRKSQQPHRRQIQCGAGQAANDNQRPLSRAALRSTRAANIIYSSDALGNSYSIHHKNATRHEERELQDIID